MSTSTIHSQPVMQPYSSIDDSKNKGIFIGLCQWFFKRSKWILKEDYILKLPDATIVVPKGFIFDGASIPPKGFAVVVGVIAYFGAYALPSMWLLWTCLMTVACLVTLFRPSGILLEGALLHDYGYKYQFLKTDNGDKYMERATRIEFDSLFLNVTMLTNHNYLANMIGFTGVRLAGFMAWREHRKNDG